MTPAQADLVGRVRALLADEPVTREVPMFGGRSFMVDEKLLVSALKEGGLLVRVAAAEHEDLLRRPGAAQATMGPERTMGPGWIEVASEALTDDGLASWLHVALAYNRTGS
ncbi:MAG: TfoX/Sxy family protein [Arachnia sp.]